MSGNRTVADMLGHEQLRKDYPWIHTPLVVGAPMRLIALADMAVQISNAGTLFGSLRTRASLRTNMSQEV
jgi:hypothetical protein